jgi:hypothetical protein
MNFFTKGELIGVACILFVIVRVSIPNFKASVMRSRDAQRKNDLGSVSEALSRFQKDLKTFPLSSRDGRILACNPRQVEDLSGRLVIEYEACEWGKDALADELDPTFPPYLKTLPTDPKFSEGLGYLYFSNGSRFQLYAHLEAQSDEENNAGVEARGLACGNRVCNYGRSYANTPLEKSLEEYENELLQKDL